MNKPKPALTTEQVLAALNPWLSEQPANVTFGDGSTEGISVGAFAANIAQASILDTSNSKPQDLVAELLCDGDQSAASTLIIDASEDEEKLLALRDRLEAAINRRLDRAFRQTLVADITASGEPHDDAYLNPVLTNTHSRPGQRERMSCLNWENVGGFILGCHSCHSSENKTSVPNIRDRISLSRKGSPQSPFVRRPNQNLN